MIPQATMERELDEAIGSSWRSMIDSPQFKDWATRIGPRLFGSTFRPRQQVLDDAVRAGDSATIIQLVRDFGEYCNRGQSLMGRGRAVWPAYTREQVRQNYERHRRGEFAGREADWARLEKDMVRAARDGQIPNSVPLAKNFGDGR
jgi:hypothetical protein